MDNNKIRNFYEEEAEYERNTLIIKEIILQVLSIDLLKLEEKIKYLDKDNKYIEYLDLLNAVTGKQTNKYYYCDEEEYVKYYNLELGKVYKVEDLNVELKVKNNEEKVLDLKARVILAKELLIKTKELKELFETNIEKGDGILSTIDNRFIIESDIKIFENIIKYLEIILEETGKLKILVTEKEVYEALSKREKYGKKSALGKWIHNIVYKEKI